MIAGKLTNTKMRYVQLEPFAGYLKGLVAVSI